MLYFSYPNRKNANDTGCLVFPEPVGLVLGFQAPWTLLRADPRSTQENGLRLRMNYRQLQLCQRLLTAGRFVRLALLSLSIGQSAAG